MRSSRWFRWTLALYPRELRERFGEEMELVLEEMLADAWRERALVGVLRVWASTLLELATVALPSRLAPVAVPALALVTALMWFIGMIGLIPIARAH